MAADKKFAEVSVVWSEDGVTVDPVEVKLCYDSEPSSVRWKISGPRPAATKPRIMWEDGSPFDQVGLSSATDGEIHGTQNRRRQGTYKYAVLFVDKDGQVKAGVDPSIINDPLP